MKHFCPLLRDGKCTAIRYLREKCNDKRAEKCEVRKREITDGKSLAAGGDV